MRLLITTLAFALALSVCLSALAGDKEKAKEYFDDGVAFYEKGQYERASYYLDKAYELDKNWQYLEYVAKTWLALERYENATAALKAYLKKGGGKVPAKKKAWAKEELDKLSKLKEHQANHEEALGHFKKGQDLFAKREYEKAIIELEEAYDLSPSWEFLELIGKTEAALKNYDRAIEAYERYLKEAGDKISGAKRQDVKREVGVLQSLVKQEADKEEALSHLEQGKSMLKKGQYDNAIKSLELAYRLYPNWEFLEYIGDALSGAKSFRRAIDAYKGFLQKGSGKIPEKTRSRVKNEIARLSELAKEEVNVEQSKSLEKRGRQSFGNRQYTKALHQFQQAYELDPRYQLFVLIGKANERLKRYQEALDAYKRYLKDGGEALSEKDRARAQERIDAIKAVLAEQARKDRARIHFKLGMDLTAQGEHEKAAIEYNKAYELDPAYQILPHIAETEIELGNISLAIDTYRKYLSEGGDEIPEDKREQAEERIDKLIAVDRGDLEPSALEGGALTEDYKPEEAEVEGAEIEGEEEDGEEDDGEPYDWDPRHRLWTWIVGGVGVGAGIGAIVTHVVANKEQEKIDDLCPGGQCPDEYLAGALDRQETVDNMRITTKVLGGVAIAGVAAGITLFFIEPLFAPQAEVDVAVIPTAGEDTAGLLVIGTF
jgi:tetratricopeptide (TPR) repeat protein